MPRRPLISSRLTAECYALVRGMYAVRSSFHSVGWISPPYGAADAPGRCHGGERPAGAVARPLRRRAQRTGAHQGRGTGDRRGSVADGRHGRRWITTSAEAADPVSTAYRSNGSPGAMG
ncbi:hypothetical protein GCM10009654_30920 [Streptomyces hebeiensis]|uniref:Uncharacterized protein n=1 Tax=Streptomyces hebeiensis TaxID=229486 RepID=A0ABN1UV11_9ACTN